MSCMCRVAVVALALVVFQNPLGAKHDDWTNLNSLRPGDMIGVIQSNQKRIEGRFQNATESSITIRADQEITMARPEVIRVYRHSGRSRTIKVAIGTAIGIAAGAILNGTLGARFRNEGGDVSEGVWIGGTAGIGAGIGALTGGHYETVYQRSSRP
jgi:hypothetical protein